MPLPTSAAHGDKELLILYAPAHNVEFAVSKSTHYRLNDSHGVGGTNMLNAVCRESSNSQPKTTGLDRMTPVLVAQSAPRLPYRVEIKNRLQ